MKNEYMRPASELSLPVPAGTKSGAPVKVGSLVGVAAVDVGTGGNIDGFTSVVMDDRSYLLDVDGAVPGAGTPVFITAGNTLTVVATGNTLFGFTVPKSDGTFATKGAGVGKSIVKLAKV